MEVRDTGYKPETETLIYETIENSDSDLSINEIAEKTGLHRNTIRPYIKVLKHTGRIVQTRNVGPAKFYNTKG